MAAVKDQRECLNYQSHVEEWKMKTLFPEKYPHISICSMSMPKLG